MITQEMSNLTLFHTICKWCENLYYNKIVSDFSKIQVRNINFME